MKRNPAIEHVLKFFRSDHLPKKLKKASRPFAVLAEDIVAAAPNSRETTICLRKLLEAKDSAVRALLDSQETT